MDSGLTTDVIIVVFRIEEELLHNVQSESKEMCLTVFCISTNGLRLYFEGS